MFILCTLVLFSCQPELTKTSAEDFKFSIQGEAQGTTYSISYYDLNERNFKPAVDSLLQAVDQSISTYVANSLVTRFNEGDTCVLLDPIFEGVLVKSLEVFTETRGSFDPTIKPLVGYWGFGPEKYVHAGSISPEKVDSLRQLVNMELLRIGLGDTLAPIYQLKNKRSKSIWLCKSDPRIQLDFNAIGQGYSVDLIAEFLESNGIKRFFVEVGGEIMAGYPKPDGTLWKFGIDLPQDTSETRELQAVVNLRNRGLATSGNYRKYYMKDGKKYAHTIDPSTGFPAEHNLLSATVVAKDAATADGYATAFMVMGVDSTLRFLETRDYSGLQVHLIYDDSGNQKTFTSKALSGSIEVMEE